MRYPSFLKPGDLIGICAPSAGVGHKPESFDKSLAVLHEEGYRTKETKSVRLSDPRGGSAFERGEELNLLFSDPEVAMVMAASGGDFLDEMLPYADFELMGKNPKWLMGASDPTGLLFPYTTLCDVASLYGSNAGSYDLLKDLQNVSGKKIPAGCHPSSGDPEGPAAAGSAEVEGRFLQDSLAFLRGDLAEQKTSEKNLGCPPFLAEEIKYETPTVWKGSRKCIHAEGRCIGGCIDVLKDLIGTPYDGAKQFTERYGEKDGIIWYFDNFALSAEMLYRTFLQMAYAGWFSNTRAILVGRTLFEKSESGMTYDEAMLRAFGTWHGEDGASESPAVRTKSGHDIPVIWEADIGHTLPHMTMINGAMLKLDYEDGKGTLNFSLR